jgi:hypothetical protein
MSMYLSYTKYKIILKDDSLAIKDKIGINFRF